MTLNTEQLEARGAPLPQPDAKTYGLEGIWDIDLSTKVIAIEDGLYIQKGKIYRINYYNKNAGTVHLLEAGLWWRMEMFELV